MPSHTNTLIYNPFILNQKSALALNIGYDLLNLSLGLFQTCSHSFSNFEDCLLIKLLSVKISTGYNKNRLI